MTLLYPEELSDREQEILRLVATGASNKEIAQRLVISPNTVKVHLRNIFSKIGAASRTEAALYAVRNGLVDANSSVIEREAQAGSETHQVDGARYPVSSGLETGLPISSTSPDDQAGETRRFSFNSRLIVVLTGFLVLVIALSFALFPGSIFEPTPDPTLQPSVSAVDNPVVTPVEAGWRELAPMPTGRSHLAAVLLNNKMYTIGGVSEQGTSSALEVYDPNLDSWDTKRNKPIAVSEVKAAVVGGKIYVPGGKLSDGQVTDTLEIYDSLQDAWETGTPMPIALSAYALAEYEGRIYLFGGWDGQTYVNSVLAYDPRDDRWSELAAMPTARGEASAAVNLEQILVVGGVNEQGALDVAELFQPNEGEEQFLGEWSQGVTLPDKRYGMSLVGIVDYLFIIGGKTLDELAIQNYQLAPFGTTWHNSSEWGYEQLAYSGTVVMGSRIYLFGGQVGGKILPNTRTIQALYTIMVPILR